MKQKISIVLGGIVVTLVFLLQLLWLKATTKYWRIKEYIEVITAHDHHGSHGYRHYGGSPIGHPGGWGHIGGGPCGHIGDRGNGVASYYGHRYYGRSGPITWHLNSPIFCHPGNSIICHPSAPIIGQPSTHISGTS